MNTTALNHGRFTVRAGATVYEDNRHVVIKVRLEGGAHGTLVKERQFDGFYRNQMMTIERNGEVSVIEFGRNYVWDADMRAALKANGGQYSLIVR